MATFYKGMIKAVFEAKVINLKTTGTESDTITINGWEYTVELKKDGADFTYSVTSEQNDYEGENVFTTPRTFTYVGNGYLSNEYNDKIKKVYDAVKKARGGRKGPMSFKEFSTSGSVGNRGLPQAVYSGTVSGIWNNLPFVTHKPSGAIDLTLFKKLWKLIYRQDHPLKGYLDPASRKSSAIKKEQYPSSNFNGEYTPNLTTDYEDLPGTKTGGRGGDKIIDKLEGNENKIIGLIDVLRDSSSGDGGNADLDLYKGSIRQGGMPRNVNKGNLKRLINIFENTEMSEDTIKILKENGCISINKTELTRIKEAYLTNVLQKLNDSLSDQVEKHENASKGEISVGDAKEKLLSCINEFYTKYGIKPVEGNKYKLEDKDKDAMEDYVNSELFSPLADSRENICFERPKTN